MESRYEAIKDLKQKGLFTKLVSLGVISIDIATRVSIYEEYVKLRKSNKKPVAISLVASSMNISVSNLYLIIRYLEN